MFNVHIINAIINVPQCLLRVTHEPCRSWLTELSASRGSSITSSEFRPLPTRYDADRAMNLHGYQGENHRERERDNEKSQNVAGKMPTVVKTSAGAGWAFCSDKYFSQLNTSAFQPASTTRYTQFIKIVKYRPAVPRSLDRPSVRQTHDNFDAIHPSFIKPKQQNIKAYKIKAQSKHKTIKLYTVLQRI